jgi:hypothetical protein
VGAENLCHQAIFVDDATRAVMPPDLGMIQVGDAIWQRLQWRGLARGAVRPVGVVEVLVLPQQHHQGGAGSRAGSGPAAHAGGCHSTAP